MAFFGQHLPIGLTNGIIHDRRRCRSAIDKHILFMSVSTAVLRPTDKAGHLDGFQLTTDWRQMTHMVRPEQITNAVCGCARGESIHFTTVDRQAHTDCRCRERLDHEGISHVCKFGFVRP